MYRSMHILEQIASTISKLPDTEVDLVVQRNNELIELKVMTMSNTGRFYNLSFGVVTPKGFDSNTLNAS